MFTLTGLESLNDDWWHGTRLASVKNSFTSCSVKEEHCGIFPLTHVWRLREDLLPESVFTQTGVIIENSTSDSSTANTHLEPVPTGAIHQAHHPQSTPGECFYVKVIKTMIAHLDEEMDLPEVGEILQVNSTPDKLYYSGQSLDGTRVGLFPRNFVKIEDNYEP